MIVAGRSAEKTAAVANSIGATALTGDFARLEDVRRVADQILALCPRIDVLANNAGAMFPTRMVITDAIQDAIAKVPAGPGACLSAPPAARSRHPSRAAHGGGCR